MTRNIVLVTVDSLRADHCGFNGANQELTPGLDELADEGVVFQNAFAPGPRTPSSMPVVMTGESLPAQTGEFTWRSRYSRIRKHLQHHSTLAEQLSRRGYTTVGLTTNPWTHGTGFDSGFDHFVELTAGDMEDPPLPFQVFERAMQVGDLGDRYGWDNKREWFVQWQNQYPNIEAMIDTARENEPFFLWIFLLDSHQPYIVPREHRVEGNAFDMYFGAFQEFRQNGESLSKRTMKRLRRAYRDSIRSTDAFVQQLHNDLSDDDPLFVFHSDHGEAFGEHGTYGHESELYDENLQVPLLVHGTSQSERVTEPISLRQLPSLLSQLADGRGLDSGRFTSTHVSAVTEDSETWTVRSNRWKYILNGSSEALFDLNQDPEEQINRSEEMPDVVESLRQLVARHQSSTAEKHQIERAVERSAPFQIDNRVEET